MIANIVIETFIEGGWVMWPILATFFLALCVILDRAAWWLRLRSSLRPAVQEQVREALGSGDFATAWKLSRDTPDPYLKNLGEGILEGTIVGLQNGVLGRKVDRKVAGQTVVERCASKVTDAVHVVVHTHSYTTVLWVVGNGHGLNFATVGWGPGHGDATGTWHLEVGCLVLVTVSVTALLVTEPAVFVTTTV